MPNDDLGSFPMPPAPNVVPDEVGPAPAIFPVIPAAEPESIQITPTLSNIPPFEATPDEIPLAPRSPQDEVGSLQAPPEAVPPESQPTLATLPPATGNSIAPIIIIVLLIIAGIGLATAVFLSAQTKKLKNQLTEITQTLEKQETTFTPTATPTIFEIPTPTIATQSSAATQPATPLNSLFPLKNAPSALQIAIDRSPNAQLILIKVDNATDAETAVTKYFFRENLSTKKYFYVAVTGKGIPEIIDKQIYVTPDDNIPSLNDSVLSDKLGLELDEAIRMAYTQCANQTACTNAPIKAQYIKTGSGIIWQLSLYTNGLSGTPLMIQINAETKAILYKSPGFANK